MTENEFFALHAAYMNEIAAMTRRHPAPLKAVVACLTTIAVEIACAGGISKEKLNELIGIAWKDAADNKLMFVELADEEIH